MKSFISKFLIYLFIITLSLNVTSPISSATGKIKYKGLSSILGKKVLICEAGVKNGGYYSSFERLDQEQHQKLKKQIDISSYSTDHFGNKYIRDIYSVYTDSQHNGTIRPLETSLKPEYYRLALKFSTAPPHIS
jgi:hypothetical protein